MKRTGIAAVLALAVVPLAAAQDREAKESDVKEITLRGCVTPAEGDDQFVLTRVIEVASPAGSTIPSSAHGRKVVFWLDDDDALAQHANKGVEVRGEIDGFEESEIEFKAGPHKEGGLLVEFEGPGDDVVIAQSKVADAIGTSGREEAEKDDIKTMLVKVDVKDVKAAEYACLD